MEDLTLKELKAMKPGKMFASGKIENSPEGLYMISDIKYRGKMLLWVAQRGGYYDWAIYAHWAYNGVDYVRRCGDKVVLEKYIRKLVPCTDEAFKMYRL